MKDNRRITLSLAAMLAICLTSATRAADDEEPAAPLSSHKQTKIISIPIGEEKVQIHTFCVDPKGRLLCSCGGEQVVTQRTPDGFKGEVIKSSPGIRVVSPEGELLAEWPVDFTPQTVNVGPDGFVYCGGAGKIAKLTMDGEIVKVIDAPNTKEMPPLPELPKEIKVSDAEVKEREDLKQKLTEQVASIRQEMIDLSTKLLKNDQPKIDQLAQELQDIYKKYAAARDLDPEEAKKLRAEGMKARQEMSKLTIQVYRSAEYQKLLEPYQEATMRLRDLGMDPMQAVLRQRNAALRSRRISGIAVNEKDVFICCQPPKGYGFQVWRGDQNLDNFEMIVASLRGCCGNMDIQAHGDKLYAAENARKNVVVFDRDGEKLASWGGSGRDGLGENFGSCCNPMNIRFDHEGNVLTSESNVGVIKRFTPEGEFLGRVGRVEIIPGCKHVAIGVADNSEKVYMLDITRSHIVLMEPVKDKAEAPGRPVAEESSAGASDGQERTPDRLSSDSEKVFESMTLRDLTAAEYSRENIDGSDDKKNELQSGTILAARTNDGRYCKFMIQDYGYDLSICWVTYSEDGAVHSQGSDLKIRGTYRGDLDSGKEGGEGIDLWWEQVDETERYLVPRNGAQFAVLRRPKPTPNR